MVASSHKKHDGGKGTFDVLNTSVTSSGTDICAVDIVVSNSIFLMSKYYISSHLMEFLALT